MSDHLTTAPASGPRALTPDEVRDLFVAHVAAMVDYWATKGDTKAQAAEGVAFSILVALDGGAAVLPRFVVAPEPHESDAAYMASLGANWYPEIGEGRRPACDIAGSLHEYFAGMRKAMEATKNW